MIYAQYSSADSIHELDSVKSYCSGLLCTGNVALWIFFSAAFCISFNLLFHFFSHPRWHVTNILLSVFFSYFYVASFCFSVGHQYMRYLGAPIITLYVILFVSLLIYVLLERFNEKLDILENNGPYFSNNTGLTTPNKLGNKKLFFCVLLGLLLAWSPYFLCNFPGSVSYDGMVQLGQFLGVKPMSNNNPVVDTWVFGLLYRLGSALFHADHYGIAAIVIFQFILMACAFSYACVTIRSMTGSACYALLVFLFYAVLPTFGGAGQVVLKDSVHMPVFVLLFCLYVTLEWNPSKKKCVLFGLALLLAALTRKAAFFYTFACGIGAILIFRKTGSTLLRVLFFSVFGSLAVYVVFSYLFLPLINIEKASERELFSLPFQQVAYISKVHKEELTTEEIEIINQVLYFDEIVSNYDPDLSNPVKACFHDGNVSTMAAFGKLYISWLFKYTREWFHAIIIGCWKYVFPFSAGQDAYRAYLPDCSSIGLDIHYQMPVRQAQLKEYARAWETSPLSILFIGPGLYNSLLLFCLGRTIIRKKTTQICYLLPLVILFLGFVFTPVNGEVRYAYPIIATSPVFASFLFANSRS